MFRWATSAAAVGATALMLVLAGCAQKGDVVGDIPWSLVAVSEDARTLRVGHEIPHCETEPGPVVVQEDAHAVKITVPEIDSGWDGACTADGRFGSDPVRLKAPLGRRQLLGGRPDAVTLLAPPVPRYSECLKLDAMARDAPARDVPWVARRVRMCNAPIPSHALALPLMTRPRNAADDLPVGTRMRESLDNVGVVLRPELARRIDPSVPAWWAPGPRRSCVLRLGESYPRFTGCRPTRVVSQRGFVLPATCTNHKPRTLKVLGVVPAGVDQVRLVPRRGRTITVAVGDDGVWSGRAPYPFEIQYGDMRFKLTYDTRSCVR